MFICLSSLHLFLPSSLSPPLLPAYSSNLPILSLSSPPSTLPILSFSPPLLPFSSIIGLYVSVVLVLSKFIRSFINELPQNLLIDGILKPDPLLKLCDDIFTVRETKNFILEEILVGKLFYIFRSPERLIEITDSAKIKTE